MARSLVRIRRYRSILWVPLLLSSAACEDVVAPQRSLHPSARELTAVVVREGEGRTLLVEMRGPASPPPDPRTPVPVAVRIGAEPPRAAELTAAQCRTRKAESGLKRGAYAGTHRVECPLLVVNFTNPMDADRIWERAREIDARPVTLFDRGGAAPAQARRVVFILPNDPIHVARVARRVEEWPEIGEWGIRPAGPHVGIQERNYLFTAAVPLGQAALEAEEVTVEYRQPTGEILRRTVPVPR